MTQNAPLLGGVPAWGGADPSVVDKLEGDLGSESLCKTHIFKFKSAVSQPIRGFHFLGNFHKNQKNTKIEQNSKNVKSDLLNFLYRYKVICSEMRVRLTSYWHY